ncbi:MAG: histidine phosphatase family protein [Phaeodactylibacter sp.]|nr:histidine phosphatase family protein [Phaeodactylibacter sp.]
MKNLYWLSVFLLLSACEQQQQVQETPAKITTFILVRHAEKADDGTDDPPLTTAGEARAQHLSFMLQQSGITAIYSTPFKRNQATAAPLANRLGMSVNIYGSNRKIADFLDEVRAKHTGEKVLIIGHSNTVPVMLNALSGSNEYSGLAENAYDDLFVVEVTGEKHSVLHLKYSPPAI